MRPLWSFNKLIVPIFYQPKLINAIKDDIFKYSWFCYIKIILWTVHKYYCTCIFFWWNWAAYAIKPSGIKDCLIYVLSFMGITHKRSQLEVNVISFWICLLQIWNRANLLSMIIFWFIYQLITLEEKVITFCKPNCSIDFFFCLCYFFYMVKSLLDILKLIHLFIFKNRLIFFSW